MNRFVRKNFNVIEQVLMRCERTVTSGHTTKNVIGSDFPDVKIPKLTLPEFLEPYFHKFEKFTAIECFETKRKYTYGEINKKSKNLAKALRKILKLENGDTVATILPNIPEYPIANLGVLNANLILTPVSPAFTSDEIYRQLIDANVKFVITQPDILSKVKEAIRKTGKDLPLMVVKTRNCQDLPNGAIDFHELINTVIDHPEVVPSNPDRITLMPYSSGTTGLPKGVQLSHANLVSNLFQFNQPEVQFFNDASGSFQEVFPTTLPFYHVYGYNVIMNFFTLHGGKLVTLEKFNPKTYSAMLGENSDSTMLFTAPPLVLMLINNEDVKKEYLKNVRLVICGAASLSLSDEQRFVQKFGDHISFVQGYGMTESTSLACLSYPKVTKGKKSSQGSVGKPIINTRMKIVDIENPESEPLGPLQPGEIHIKGPQVMQGYFNRPEETKNCITKEGWLKTGDIGYHNQDGFFFITDRLKELIKVRGYQVPPAELEAIIRSFPGVAEAAVIGIPHPSSGEVPRAYVVPKKGAEVDVKKLNEYVTTKVAKYKKLEGGVAVVDEIPKSPSGKILRRTLKEEFLKGSS